MAALTAAVADRGGPAAELVMPADPLPGVVNEFARGLPAARLRPFIAHYSGYRQAGVEPARGSGRGPQVLIASGVRGRFEV